MPSPVSPHSSGSVRSFRATVALAATLAVAASLFLWTLYPGVGGRVNAGDSAKFQYVGQVLGVPHQPGYPQFVVLSWLWTRVPWPLELARQVNLLSALLSIAAGGFLFAALARWTGRVVPAALAVLSLLLARSVWVYSTEAEVYALQLAWSALLVWLAVRWRLAGEPESRPLWGLMAAGALSFGNHPMAVTLLPGLVWLVVTGAPRLLRTARFWARAILWASIGVAQYGFLLWRAHAKTPFLEGIRRNGDLLDLLRTMTGRRFTEDRLHLAEPSLERLAALGREALHQLMPVLLVLAAVGLVRLWRRDRPLAGFLALTGLSGTTFLLVYRIGDWAAYQTPVWLALAVLAGIGLAAVAESGSTARWWPAVAALWAVTLGATVARDLPAVRVVENRDDVSRLIAAAGSDKIVVAYPGPGYRTKQLVNYYRYGLDLERARGLDVRQAAKGFDEQYLYLKRRPMVFAAQGVRAWFDRLKIDYLPAVAPEAGDLHYFVTGTDWPLAELRVVPTPEGVEVHSGDGRRPVLIEAWDGVQVLVVAGRERYVRAVVPFPIDGVAKTFERVRQLFRRVAAGDRVCIVVQGRGAEARRLAESLAHGEVETSEGFRTLVALTTRDRRGVSRERFLVDPTSSVTVRLDTLEIR
ncbi:MAG: DUF2723 domain-containing protein [Thermoanaerobaculia bacterium]